jgi:diadenosine tetraphosphate (Ap4A) HIT family hydrolase
VAELPASWVSAAPRAPLPGYACVVCKRHVVEPYELAAEDGAAFWADAMTAARVLAELYEPVKMNYEIHGNVIPHLHLHLYPRFIGDPLGTGALQLHADAFLRSEQELARIRPALEADGQGTHIEPR